MDIITSLRESILEWVPYLNNKKKSNRNHKRSRAHHYPTPTERNIENPAKRVVINKRDTNPFNNATFFIILQIMILIYVPAASLLAPYYEDQGDISNNIANQQQVSSDKMELFNPLQAKIVDNYTTYPAVLHAVN